MIGVIRETPRKETRSEPFSALTGRARPKSSLREKPAFPRRSSGDVLHPGGGKDAEPICQNVMEVLVAGPRQRVFEESEPVSAIEAGKIRSD
jgi:hypothetical protein